MVWITISEVYYDSKYDYNSSQIMDRYNEKFDKVVKFLNINRSRIIEVVRLCDDRILIKTDFIHPRARDGKYHKTIGTTFLVENLTRNQWGELHTHFKDDDAWF